MSRNSFSKVSLLVITDQNEYNYNRFGQQISYIERKLNIIGSNLTKVSFLSSDDYNEIKDEITSTKSGIVTTTSEKLDPILAKLLVDINPNNIENISPNVTLYRSTLFLVNSSPFYDNIASIISTISVKHSRKVKVQFETANELEAFKKQRINTEISEVKSRYGDYVIEVDSTEVAQLKPDYFLNNNLSNSDQFVYNFTSICRSFCSSNEGLKFLANKIDIDSFCARLSHSVSVIERALKGSKSTQTCIAFNGGKDCCVVLYLFFACALRLGFDFPLNVIIISIANPFDQMERFIFDELKSFYAGRIEYIVLDDTTKTLKERLFTLKASHPDLENILMGTRRSDAHYFKNMCEFEPTDADWPPFVRVNPILDWTYSEVWFFIRLLKLPYCVLYDQGYTSVDHANNTRPNQTLFDSSSNTYLPAYFLSNDDHERTSRH